MAKKQWSSYKEASAFAQKEGITTQAQWNKRAKQGLPENIPTNPWMVYKEEFKNGGLGRFLGTGTIAHRNRQFATYEEAAVFAQKEGITNRAQWGIRVKQGLPENIPADPWGVYKEEFKNGGLGRFLGLKNRPGESKIERSLRYALEQAFAEPVPFLSNPKVRGISQNWRVDALLSKERLIVEYDGSRYHHGRERKDTLKTQDLLKAGYHVVRIRGTTPQHSLKPLRKDWDMVLDERQTHLDQIALIFDHLTLLASLGLLPLSPESVSRLEKWKNQELPQVNFRKVLEEYDGFVTYEEASSFAKKEGITTYAQWNKRAKQGLPENIPTNPWRAYKEEFKNGGMGRFLGTRAIAPQNRQFVTYEEASAFAQKEGITTVAQWNKRAKQGLPEKIPSHPGNVYKQEFKNGGWGRFLGTGAIANQNRQFVNYEEASTFAQKEGITTYAQWNKRAKQGLPENIPANPLRVYKEEFKNGGWGRFLGTGVVANSNRKFANYKEASAFAQKEDITTRDQWNKRAKQGLPEDIPKNPWQVYKEEFKNGGLRRFLATGPFAKQSATESPSPASPSTPQMPSLSQWRAQRGVAPTAPEQPRVAPKRPKP